jgi:hypothetical protein
VLFNLSQYRRQAVNQRIIVVIKALRPHDSIVEFECRQEDPHGATCACGERDQLEPGTVFLQLALETRDEVVLNSQTNLLRGIGPVSAGPPLPLIRFKPTEERNNSVEISACRAGTGAFDGFGGKDRQREMKAVIEVKDQNRVPVVSTFPSDDAESSLHRCGRKQIGT